MDLNETRLANLRALIKEWDGPTKLSQRLGYRSPAFLVQISGPNPTRTLSEKTARKIERDLALPLNWFDTNKDLRPSNVDEGLLRNVVKAVVKELDGTTPDKLAEVILLVYEDSVRNGLQPEFVKRVASLVQ